MNGPTMGGPMMMGNGVFKSNGPMPMCMAPMKTHTVILEEFINYIKMR